MEEGWQDIWMKDGRTSVKIKLLRNFRSDSTGQGILKVSRNGVKIAHTVQLGKDSTRNKELHYRK